MGSAKARLCLLVCGFVFMHGVQAVLAGGTVDKKIAVPGHGALVLEAPKSWEMQVRQPPNDLPPTIKFGASSGEAFAVLVTALWEQSGANSDFDTEQGIRRLAQEARDRISSQAVEKNVKVLPLGSSGPGYYFTATDRAPKPGEFKYLAQGVTKVGGLVCTFTVLTMTKQSSVQSRALEMLRNARHVASN